jgi:site-specific DNA recombinase
LNALFAFAATTPPDIVLVPKIDRLSRDMLVFTTLRKAFQDAGIELRFGDVPASDDLVTTALSENILAAISSFEKSRILARTMQGRRAKVAHGSIATGTPPYGYLLRKTDQGTALDVDEAQGAVVKHIFDWYVRDGISTRQIARRLSEEGVISATGNTTWACSTLRGILCAPTYTGQWYFGRTCQVPWPDGVGTHRKPTKQVRNPDPARIITVSCPALIEEGLWKAAQAKLAFNRTQLRRQSRRSYPLRGRLHCAICGQAVFGSVSSTRGQRYFYYRHRGARAGCTSLFIQADTLERAVLRVLMGFVAKPAEAERYIRAVYEREAASTVRSGARLKEIETRLKTAEKAKRKLAEAFLNDLMTAVERERHKETLLARIKGLQTEREELRAALESSGAPPSLGTWRLAFGTTLTEWTRYLDPAEFDAMQHRMDDPKTPRAEVEELGAWMEDKRGELTDRLSAMVESLDVQIRLSADKRKRRVVRLSSRIGSATLCL